MLVLCCSRLPARSADLSAQLNSRFGGGDGDLPEQSFGLKEVVLIGFAALILQYLHKVENLFKVFNFEL